MSSDLKMYIEQKNKWRRVFKQKELDMMNLTPKDVRGLISDIWNELSPENLTCDGELRGEALVRKKKMLNGALAALDRGVLI